MTPDDVLYRQRLRAFALAEELSSVRAACRVRAAALTAAVTGLPQSRVVLEAGPRSPWLSRLVAEFGHEVVVANPRQVALIARSQRKTDRLDAAWLARLGRFDPSCSPRSATAASGASTTSPLCAPATRWCARGLADGWSGRLRSPCRTPRANRDRGAPA